MIEPLFTKFEIDTLDIWTRERDEFLIGNRTIERVAKIKANLEYLIVEKAKEQNAKIKPLVTIADYDNGINPGYWESHVNRILEANFYDQIKNNYFSGYYEGIDSFYSYNHSIIITVEDFDFDFWFTLKICEYDFGLKNLYGFLDYHLNSSFNNEMESIESFLEIVQAQNYFNGISDKIKQLIGKWIKKKSKAKLELSKFDDKVQNETSFEKHEIPEIVENGPNGSSFDQGTNDRKSTKSITGDYSTFYLTKIENDPGTLKKGFWLTQISEIYHDLVTSKFILGKGEPQNLEKIFKGKPLSENEKLVWIGSYIELKWFVELLMEKKICVDIKGLDKWIIAQNCFNYSFKGNKAAAKIEKYTSISEASGEITERKNTLTKIITKLELACK